MKKCPFRRGLVITYHNTKEYKDEDNLDCMGNECEIWNETTKRCSLSLKEVNNNVVNGQ